MQNNRVRKNDWDMHQAGNDKDMDHLKNSLKIEKL